MKTIVTVAALTLVLTACGKGANTSSVQSDDSGVNAQASNCEIYIEKMQADASSHGSGSVDVIVRVPFLGDGETIRTVGFNGHVTAQDLGNAPSCNWSPEYNDPTDKIYQPTPTGAEQTQPGESLFSMPVLSGTVEEACPGYNYSWTGEFFVQTNVKTYWVNPSMDPNQHFTFDAPLWDHLSQDGGIFNYVGTNSGSMHTYNPLACTR